MAVLELNPKEAKFLLGMLEERIQTVVQSRNRAKLMMDMTNKMNDIVTGHNCETCEDFECENRTTDSGPLPSTDMFNESYNELMEELDRHETMAKKFIERITEHA